MELSPKADLVPFFKYPRIDDAGVRKLKKIAADAGVGIASLLPVLRWSGPDEDQRQAAVRAWKRAIQIAVDLGVDRDELRVQRPSGGAGDRRGDVPAVDGRAAADLRAGGRAADHRTAPRRLHRGRYRGGGPDPRSQPRLDRLPLLHPARLPPGPRATDDHRRGRREGPLRAPGRRLEPPAPPTDLRYISNPPGNTARVHQHMEMGRGEVDYDEVFAALASVGFDGVISSCVFGWEEDADGVSDRQRDKALALIDTHFGADTEAAIRSSKITTS